MSVEVTADDVARAFGREVTSYDVEPLDPTLRLHSVTGGVFRVRADGESLVLKVVQQGVDADPGALWVSGEEPTHRNYWKREWLAFDSGLLDNLPGDLRAPRTASTTMRSDREAWLWMQDVDGRTGPAIELEDYAVIARALGTTQGALAAADQPLPSYDWLSRNWVRGWTETVAGQLRAVSGDDAWDDERLASMRPFRDRAMGVWAARAELLGIVESAPQTLVHLDFWPNNIFVGYDDEVVAIDWSQVGIGGVAQDLDQLTLDPVWMQIRPDFDPQQIEWRVLPAYGEGLRAAGFDVDESDLQRWYAAAAAAKYVPLMELQTLTAADPAKVAAQEARFGRSFAEVTAVKARVVRRAVELGEFALGSDR